MGKAAASKTIKTKAKATAATTAAAAPPPKAAANKKTATKTASQKATGAKSSATKSSAPKASTTKAAAKRNANALLSEQVDEQPAAKTTRSRAVFPNQSTMANIPQSQHIAPPPARTTQSRVAAAPRVNPPHTGEISNENGTIVRFGHAIDTPAKVSDKLELELQRRENEMLKKRLSILTEIARPELPKSSPMKLATIDLILGLAIVPKGDPALNEIRKKMISWIWVNAITPPINLVLTCNNIGLSQDTVRDVIFMLKVDHKLPRYATYDGLTKTQGDSLVASIMEQIRSAEILRRPFFKRDEGDIPLFDVHWPIREIVKTVLYNQKKAAGRVKSGPDDIKKMFDSLSPECQQGLCDPPCPLISKAPKVPGAGRGGPPKSTTSIGSSSNCSPSLATAPIGPPSSRFSEFHPSPSPLRELNGDVSNYTLNELSVMSESDSEFFSDKCVGGPEPAEEGVEEELLEDDEEPLEEDDEEAQGIVMSTSDVEEAKMDGNDEEDDAEDDAEDFAEDEAEEEEAESGIDDVDEMEE